MSDPNVASELGRPNNQQHNDSEMESADKRERDELSIFWKFVTLLCCYLSLSLCLGLNYGLWPLVDGLREFYQEYYYDSDGVDPKWIVYINITMTGITAYVAVTLVYNFENGVRISAVCGACLSTLGLLISGFVRGVGTLCATYGFITGLGYGLLLTPTIGLIPIYFPTRYTYYNAVAFSGTSLCIFYVPALFDYVTEVYGLHSMFVILGCLNAQLVFVAFLFPPMKHFLMASSHERRQRITRAFALLKASLAESDRPLFSTVIASMFLIGVGYNILLLHLRQFAVYNGTSAADAATVMTVCGVFMIVGQLLHGYLTFTKRVERDELSYRRFCYSMALIVVGLAALFSSVAESFAGHAALAALIGLGSGIYFPLLFVLLRQSFISDGDGRLAAALAIGLPVFGVGALIGLPIGDLLNESFQNYNSSFFLAGAALLLVVCLMAYKLVSWIRGSWKTRKANRAVADAGQPDSA